MTPPFPPVRQHTPEQSPQRHLLAAFDILAELAGIIDETPRCLGLTGQMHGGLLIDEGRVPLTPLITWQDRRAVVADGNGKTLLDDFRSRCPDAEIAKTGCTPAAGYLAVTLFGMRRRGEVPEGARNAVLLADWIAAELGDAEPATDRSNAASTGLYDLSGDCWSLPLVAAAGIDDGLLPPVRESGEMIGALTTAIAERVGLPKGLPICNPIGDNQAAVVGSVPSGDASLQINIGTGGQINWPIPEFHRVPGMDTRYLPLGRYMLVGAGTAGGAAYAWVTDTVEQWLRAFGFETSRDTIYDRLAGMAAAIPDDSGGLVCEPFFRGTRQQPDARGRFTGIDPHNFTPGHVARAVMNGIAEALHEFYESAGEHRPQQPSRIVGSGNGLRQNPLLAKSIATRFQCDVWLPEHREEAAYGAALLAGCQTGVWSNLEAAGTCLRLRRVAQGI